VLLLGAMAFVFTLAEGAALDWSAVLLRGLDAPAWVAAAALSVFLGALTVGRLLGNRLVARFGPVRVFRVGALTAGVGFGSGLLPGSPAAALAGLALLGLGLANLVPVVISAAGRAGAMPVATAVARVSMLGYLGSFTGPALVGLLTTEIPLVVALLVPAAGVTLTAAGARLTSSEVEVQHWGRASCASDPVRRPGRSGAE
jgi:MFS family permease